MSRYDDLFASLEQRREGAFVPFIMLGDPDPDTNVELISTLIDNGADALELGVPFSDPVADGPTIQAADIRAFDGGTDFAASLEIIRRVRSAYPEIPIGLLCYGNVAFSHGLDSFYEQIHAAGADSVLIPDIPVRESTPFLEAAQKHQVDPVFIAPPNVNEETLERVAAISQGYIYTVSRLGVTGVESESQTMGLPEIVKNIQRFGGAPSLLGFGISTPQHVADAIQAGAAGAITGSAIASIIEKYCEGEHPQPRSVTDLEALKKELGEFVSRMKAATAR
ncbi:Tryptophan synthase alpha chain [Corynebacterium ciconiae DSM 44920]|uniref:tryptophan synthase subunit alpha n=1 Tax=Corynebacterium ciconiae TaxID=227319 RepID=UPI00035DBED2|nr:tryptophan synthase subunit alpha [Corynebacterium ciconiae]WKD62277.1 Tryptophan synthase alpha chain [Corynebacterium ciconiae DSM 44920]